MRAKQLILIGSVGFAAWITLSTIVFKGSAAHISELRSLVHDRQRDNERLEVEVAALRRRLGALSDRPEVLERQVRDELGLVRPDEVIFSFQDEDEGVGR